MPYPRLFRIHGKALAILQDQLQPHSLDIALIIFTIIVKFKIGRHKHVLALLTTTFPRATHISSPSTSSSLRMIRPTPSPSHPAPNPMRPKFKPDASKLRDRRLSAFDDAFQRSTDTRPAFSSRRASNVHSLCARKALIRPAYYNAHSTHVRHPLGL
ncbi:hypothetical protein BD626DRAFT_203815 [Schizophyllum amplum]|uniref:Uncharacterized protein n=1 Tax=Schizophyllum amplum TaxID=97359 RepID=A0A550BZN0_9AGAR|nr:hypothetical protein BD626DRAFT_203815 [Auriculariopsis ampla]